MPNQTFFCAICSKLVREGSDAICCDFCDNWVWSCLKCNSKFFPFNSCYANFDSDWNLSHHDVVNPQLVSFFNAANATSSNDNDGINEHDNFGDKLNCK